MCRKYYEFKYYDIQTYLRYIKSMISFPKQKAAWYGDQVFDQDENNNCAFTLSQILANLHVTVAL